METETKSAFARRCGVNASQVTRWIEAGSIEPEAIVGQGRTAQINIELALRQIAARRDAGQALGNGARTRLRPPPAEANEAPHGETLSGELEPGSPEYQRERARLVRAQADAQERKNAEAAGDLCSIAERERVWGAVFVGVRSVVLAVTGRVRDRHPDLSATVIRDIDGELRAALKELSSGRFLD